MEFIRINSKDDKYFNDTMKIYQASFPIFEQRTIKNQIEALEKLFNAKKVYILQVDLSKFNNKTFEDNNKILLMFCTHTKHMEYVIRIYNIPKKYKNWNNLIFHSYAIFANFPFKFHI